MSKAAERENGQVFDPVAEAKQVTDAVYPGYQEQLRIAHDWLLKGQPWAGAAVIVLEHLRDEYPYALKVGAELVLGYLELGPRERAKKELAALEEKFPVGQDEETLCRFGRLYREIGDDWIKEESPTDEQFHGAKREYERAWGYYDRAFAIRSGHYPGINRASLFLLQGWATRPPEPPHLKDSLTAQAAEAATHLLARRNTWPHETPEDDVWHLTTAAEAQLLLREWDASVKNYRAAVAHSLAGQFHHESMGKEVRRLLRPLREVGNLGDATVAELRSLFPAPPP